MPADKQEFVEKPDKAKEKKDVRRISETEP